MGVVLVVDDAAELRDVVVEILRDDGHSAMSARTYDEARAILAVHDVSLVLLDTIGDPRASGEMAPLPSKHPPVVLFSAWPKLDERAARIGAVGWLAKPFAIDDLLTIVRMHTAGSGASQRELAN